jgi:hypothetical protein
VLNNKQFVKVWKKFCNFYRKYGCKGMDELWGGPAIQILLCSAKCEASNINQFYPTF